MLVTLASFAWAVHRVRATKDHADIDIKRVRGTQFELLENEFRALQSVVTVEMAPDAKQLIRSRMVICVEMMKRLVSQGILVTRERRSDGFGEFEGIYEWTGPYEKAVSTFPEWPNRERLVNDIYMRTSG